jgi:PST family polysaccharide transporter
MRFSTLSAIDIASSCVTLVATVAAAWWLRSYWALWLGAFVATLFSNVLTWRSSRWRPSVRVSFEGVGRMIRFGGALTGFNLINFLHRNLDNVLIGKVWGPGALGLYDRSYRLMMFPLQNINAPIGRVMLPVLSRLQDEPARYRRSFLLTVRAIMLGSIPAVAVAAATSDQLIPFLLGERWREAAPIFFWLSLAAFTQPIGNSMGWLFISSGRAGALMRWGAFITAALVPAFIVGVQWGPVGVAKAYFGVVALSLPFLFAYSVRGTPLKAMDLYAVCVPPFAAAGVTWAIIHWIIPPLPILLLLAVSLPMSYGLCLLALCMTTDGRQSAATIWFLATSGLSSKLAKVKRPEPS